MSPVSGGKENISMTTLEFVLVFGHVSGPPPGRPALRIGIRGPIVECLIECAREASLAPDSNVKYVGESPRKDGQDANILVFRRP